MDIGYITEDLALSVHKSNTTPIKPYRTVKKKKNLGIILVYQNHSGSKTKRFNKAQNYSKMPEKQGNVIHPRE